MNKIQKKIRNIKFAIQDIPYYYGKLKRRAMYKIRFAYGWCASKFIHKNRAVDLIYIPTWKINLFKCVTPDDIYIITGIWHALIKAKRCEGYNNFAITDKTYHRIGNALSKNYKWNEQTWYDNRADSKIAFTWMNYSPISIQGIPDNHIMWSVYDVRRLCTKQENGGWKFDS